MNAPIKPNSMAPSETPIFDPLGYAIGCDDANDWLHRAADAVSPPASSAAWRTERYAEEADSLEGDQHCLQLLSSWEQGFDETLAKTRCLFALTAEEARIIRAYRDLQSGAQNSALRYMEIFSADPWARRRIASCLRIVAGGAA